MEPQMRFASAMTTNRDITEAGQILTGQILLQMQGKSVDLALIFLSPHFRTETTDFLESLRNTLNPKMLLGSTAEGVIGRKQEIELSPAISLIAAHLPNVSLTPYAMQLNHWEQVVNDSYLFEQVVDAPKDPKLFLLLADPFSTPIEMVLTAFNNYFPNLPVMGGMASGSIRPGGNTLILNDRVVDNGVVGVTLGGSIDVDVIISQGCKPIGQTLTVTHARKNMIFSLEGSPPMEHIQKLVNELSSEDRDLLKNGLFIGRAIATDQNVLGRGDFLIRGVMGIDKESGAMVVGDYISNNEIIQFHVRDASTAEEDLEMMLTPQQFYDTPCGGLLFSCNGRGTRLYGHTNGDISTIRKVVGNIDLAGFFCAGEIGPIGSKNFLHGHTANLVLFRPEQITV